MTIYLGSDHRGFNLKEKIKSWLLQKGEYAVADLGNTVYDVNDDYPDFAHRVALEIAKNPDVNKGVVFCGSGVGVDIEVNRHKGVRAALMLNEKQVAEATRDDHINVLAIAADFTDEAKAKKGIEIWLKTTPSHEERYERRVKKIDSQH